MPVSASEETLEHAVEAAVSFSADEAARIELERLTRPVKARWGPKKRSLLRPAAGLGLGELWPLALAAAHYASSLADTGIRSRVHSPRGF